MAGSLRVYTNNDTECFLTVKVCGMRKNPLLLIIALSAVFGVIASLAPAASANNGRSIDQDPALPTCTYATAITGNVNCNRPVVIIDNIPDDLEDDTFNDQWERFGINYYVECAHVGSVQTVCVIIDQLFDVPAPTPTPTPTPTPVNDGVNCPQGQVSVLNNGVPVCVIPNPAAAACPTGLIDAGVTVEGLKICSAPAPVPGFTG